MTRSKEIFEQMQSEFLTRIDEVESGNLSALELAADFKEEMNWLEQLQNERKSWLNENRSTILDEAENHNGIFGGFKFSTHTATKYVYSGIPEWLELDDRKKEIEKQAQEALKAKEKGQIIVDEDGCEIPAADVKRTFAIKIEKAK